MVLRSLAWTVAKKPLRRYDPPVQDQHGAIIEHPLSIQNVLLDALDLMSNFRGIGWSWSNKPFPKSTPSSTSIINILGTLFLKFLAFDASQSLMHHVRPSTNFPEGDSIFDPTLSLVPRYAWAGFCTVCGAVMVYSMIDMFYHIITLIGLILLREPAWRWPQLTHRPWMSTSIADFWTLRWHQIFRHVFITLGSRPFGALLGRPGAVLGAFTVSAVMHDIGMWGLGHGTEFSASGGFFILMGVGAVLEYGFKQVTGLRVRGIWGWVWTMVWSISWGTLLIDAWARRGMMASDFFPYAPHPGRLLVDTIISL
jgi:membrane bound O-acyltransferase family protein